MSATLKRAAKRRIDTLALKYKIMTNEPQNYIYALYTSPQTWLDVYRNDSKIRVNLYFFSKEKLCVNVNSVA